MNLAASKKSPGGVAKRFKERILHTYFVRCDMSLILAVVIASGIGASKLMLELGLHSLPVRYPLALLFSFLAFLLLIKVWIWYVFCRNTGGPDLTGVDPGDIQISGGGSGGPNPGTAHFGGGDSGGGGASDSWEDGSQSFVTSSHSSPSSGGGGGGSGFDLDLGDDWAILLLVVALVLAIAGASGYLIYAAPNILPEAAWQATLAAGLARVAKPSDPQGWLKGVLRSCAIPFSVVLVFVVALAWVTHNHCPAAVKLSEALFCADR
jgi:hypothetical protein